MPKQSYSLIYAPATKEHLLEIDKEHHSLVRETIVQQFTFEPEVESKPEALEASCGTRIGVGDTLRSPKQVSRVLQSAQQSKTG